MINCWVICWISIMHAYFLFAYRQPPFSVDPGKIDFGSDFIRGTIEAPAFSKNLVYLPVKDLICSEKGAQIKFRRPRLLLDLKRGEKQGFPQRPMHTWCIHVVYYSLHVRHLIGRLRKHCTDGVRWRKEDSSISRTFNGDTEGFGLRAGDPFIVIDIDIEAQNIQSPPMLSKRILLASNSHYLCKAIPGG